MEKKVKERLENISNQIFISSRNEIYLSMRFLEPALFRFSYELSLSTQMLGTNGEQIFYNPKYLLELYEESSGIVNRAYLHMLLHCLFQHLFKEEKENHQDYNYNYTLWDLSCDIAIESILDSFEGISCILSKVSEYRENIYKKLKNKLSVLTAEGIYLELKEMDVTQKEWEQLRKEFQVDDHCFWEKQKEDREKKQQKKDNKQRDQTMTAWQEIAKKAQTAMETIYQQIGDRSGSLKTMLKIQTRRRDNYKQFLRQFAVIKEEMKLDLDSFDYIPYTFGLSGYGKKKETQIPLIEPLEYKERYGIDEFAIAVDTSGSISKEQIEEFFIETMQILQSEETFFRKVTIYILQCDAKLQKKMIIKSREDLQSFMDTIEISGFGGTDFRPVFSYLEKLLEQGILTKLRGLLYFTDGFGIYPERMPSFETVFILPADTQKEPQVPVWATKLFVDFPRNLTKGCYI